MLTWPTALLREFLLWLGGLPHGEGRGLKQQLQPAILWGLILHNYLLASANCFKCVCITQWVTCTCPPKCGFLGLITVCIRISQIK